MIIVGNYEVAIQFGRGSPNQKSVYYLDSGMLQEMVITLDMEKVLPTLRLKVNDPSGVLTHVQPFDKVMNTVTVSFAEVGKSIDESNEFVFTIYRKTPTHLQGGGAFLDIVGIMETQAYFSPSYTRCSCALTAKQFIGQVIQDAIGGDVGSRYEISNTLDYTTTIYQPNLTNSEFLMDLRDRLRGQNGEGDYKIFVSMLDGYAMINVKTWNELALGPLQYVFIYGDKAEKDIPPVFNCKTFDNYMLMGAPGVRKQDYSYFDYDTSSYTQASINLNEMVSLTDYHLIDGSDSENSDSIFFGRNHEYTSNFVERATNSLYSRAANLSKLWADTQGLYNLQPGAIVQILYGINIGNDPNDYQYSGFWMVERVVHILQKSFTTRMLLTRTGVDTMQKTSLLKTIKRRTKPTRTIESSSPATAMFRK